MMYSRRIRRRRRKSRRRKLKLKSSRSAHVNRLRYRAVWCLHQSMKDAPAEPYVITRPRWRRIVIGRRRRSYAGHHHNTRSEFVATVLKAFTEPWPFAKPATISKIPRSPVWHAWPTVKGAAGVCEASGTGALRMRAQVGSRGEHKGGKKPRTDFHQATRRRMRRTLNDIDNNNNISQEIIGPLSPCCSSRANLPACGPIVTIGEIPPAQA
jgi:hypothetical protein